MSYDGKEVLGYVNEALSLDALRMVLRWKRLGSKIIAGKALKSSAVWRRSLRRLRQSTDGRSTRLHLLAPLAAMSKTSLRGQAAGAKGLPKRLKDSKDFLRV